MRLLQRVQQVLEGAVQHLAKERRVSSHLSVRAPPHRVALRGDCTARDSCSLWSVLTFLIDLFKEITLGIDHIIVMKSTRVCMLILLPEQELRAMIKSRLPMSLSKMRSLKRRLA